MSLSISQQLTIQFYTCNKQWRGWHVSGNIVDQEPPFAPFMAPSAAGSNPKNTVSLPESDSALLKAYPDTDETPEVVLYAIARSHRAVFEYVLSRSAPAPFEIIAKYDESFFDWPVAKPLLHSYTPNYLYSFPSA